jgi:hypothetical protein
VGLLVFLALAHAAVGQTAKLDPSWVYVSHPLKWEAPPRKVHLNIKTASAEIVILYPSGELSVVGCLLIKQRDGRVTISQGDGEVVKAGSWTSDGDVLNLTSRVVYRTVARIGTENGQPNPEPEVRQVLQKTANSLWQERKRRYAHLPEFDDLESLRQFAVENQVGSDAKPN